MHELGLVCQIVKSIDEVYDERGLTEISEIALDIGEMSDVVPVYIKEAWKSVAPTTRYPDAEMTIIVIPARAKCLDCGTEDSVRAFAPTCPSCHSERLTLLSGKGFFINSITAR